MQQTLQRVEGKLVFVEPKSEKSRRTVRCQSQFKRKRHLTHQKRERLKSGAIGKGQT